MGYLIVSILDLCTLTYFGPLFLLQNFEFQYFGGFSEEKNIYGDMKILLISILGHHKIGLDLGVISMQSRFFS